MDGPGSNQTAPKRRSYTWIPYHTDKIVQLTNFMELSPSWEAASHSATRELYGTQRFITVFTRVLHLSISRARWIQSIPHQPISLRYILIWSTHLRLGLPSSVFLSGFSINNLHAFLFPPIRATCPAHLNFLDVIVVVILDGKYTLWSSLLCSFLQPLVTSSLRSKYSPQHPVLKHPQSMFLP
jgi:hypothetical protein